MTTRLPTRAVGTLGVLPPKDWSFLARRLVGPNWYLAGESAGFADPILAAGLTLAQSGARELAYVLLAIDRGEHDPVRCYRRGGHLLPVTGMYALWLQLLEKVHDIIYRAVRNNFRSSVV